MIGAVLISLQILSILPGILFVIYKYRIWKTEGESEKRGFFDFYFLIITDPANSPLLNKKIGQRTPWIPYFIWFVFVNIATVIYLTYMV